MTYGRVMTVIYYTIAEVIEGVYGCTRLTISKSARHCQQLRPQYETASSVVNSDMGSIYFLVEDYLKRGNTPLRHARPLSKRAPRKQK